MSFLHIRMRKCYGCNEIKKEILGLLYLSHCVKYPKMQAFSDPYFSVYGQNRIRFCPYTGNYRSEKAHISGYFTHCDSTELYKIFDTNSKIAIPYKWLLHSILRIFTIQRLSQLKVAQQKHFLFFLPDIHRFIFSQSFSF